MRQSMMLALVLAWAATGAARGQDPADLTVLDKTEVFIQHLVKVARLDPSRYQALVLQYEIGRALRELAAHECACAAEGEPCEHDARGARVGGAEDFIQSVLKELHPRYAEALALQGAGKLPEARALADAVAKDSGSPDAGATARYLSAYANLLAAELQFEAGKDYEAVIRRAEALTRDERLYLAPDYRACELVALCFQKLDRPLFAFLQYALLLTDYPELPEAAAARAQEAIQALADECGRPLGRVAGWMNEVEKLLRSEITAREPTQLREGEVVAALDKLIELQEARERRTCSNCGSQGCNGRCRGGRAAGSRSNSPAQVSSLPRAKGEFLLHGVSQGDRDSIWGQLRDRDAARALQGFRGKLPPHYEKLLEEYYKLLSKIE